jgi:hypothetical protein
LTERTEVRALIPLQPRAPRWAVVGVSVGRGWVLPGRRWVPVADFPLAAHQARTCHVSERGLLARALWPFPRYVNSVLFLPESQLPEATPVD